MRVLNDGSTIILSSNALSAPEGGDVTFRQTHPLPMRLPRTLTHGRRLSKGYDIGRATRSVSPDNS